MDENTKQKLKDAMESGKNAVGEMKEVIKNITKEVAEKSKIEGEDLQKSTTELFSEIGANLKNVGKSSAEFVQAAFSGVLEGVKESASADNNHFKSLFSSLGSVLKNLGAAGYFVSKESFNGVKSFFDKKKEEMKSKNDQTK